MAPARGQGVALTLAPRALLAGAGCLIVLATTAVIVGVWAQQGAGLSSSVILLAYPVGAVFALREHLRGSARGAPVVLGLTLASSILLFSVGLFFLLGLALLLAAVMPRSAWLTPPHAAQAVAVAALVAAGPVLGDIVWLAADPCGSVDVEPWGARSGGGSLSPGASCPQGTRGTSVTLDRLLALAALGLAGIVAALAAARQGPRIALAAAALLLLVTLGTSMSPGGAPMVPVAAGCLLVLAYALRQRPAAPASPAVSAGP